MIPMYSYPGPGAMRRVLRRILTPLVCGAFLLAGCSKDLADEPGRVPADPEPPAAESGTLNLSISVSGVTSASPGTYALTPEQEGIVDMEKFNVLLFRAEAKAATDSEFKFVRYAPATERDGGDAAVDNNGAYQRHFTIELPQEGTDEALKYYKVMVVANYSEAGTNDAAKSEYWNRLLGANATLETARSAIRFAQEDGKIWNTAGGDPTPLPLWGETQTAFTTQVVRVATIHLLRAVARIDVGVNLSGKIMDDKGQFTGRYDLTSADYKGNDTDLAGHSFEIEGVTLHNAAREGFIAPDPAHLDRTGNGLSVNAPTFDDKLALHESGLTYTKEGGDAGNMLRSQIYLPETPNGTDDNTSAFYLVVKGKYNGGASTYYRIDFYDRAAKGDDAGSEHEGYVKPSAENRYDILRNHAYVINILRVRGDGYPTEADAAASEPINMEVDVYSWDTGDGSMGNMVTDGQYKLALSSTQLRYHQDGTAQEVTVFTDFELKGDETLDKGWHLTMRKTDVTVNGQDYSGDVKVEIYRDGTWEELTKEDQGESYFWTDGLPHTQYRLRVGLSRFDESNAAGLMERTLRLLFTAGRMSQSLELVQDVKNTRTLSLLQQKLYFPKYPQSRQQVIVKSSPAGATYYVAWTKDGQTYRMNLSDPQAGPVVGREGDLGGFEQLEEADKALLPDGFFAGAYAGHPLGDGTDNCGAITFFETESETLFSLLPSNWDAAHNGNVEPVAPRSWRFEIEGYWDEETNYDKNPERTKLDVEQSYYEVKWYVDAVRGGELVGPDDPGTPEDGVYDPDDPRNIYPNFIRVSWDATGVTPHVATQPADLPWYFVSKSETGNLSGEEWVTNWSEYPNVTRSGAADIPFTLLPNPTLQPRTVTMQAYSPTDGFDETNSTLTIEQGAGPLRLEIVPSTNVTQGGNFTSQQHSGENVPTGRATYTLDMGTAAARRLYALSVRANTDWWWEWRKTEGGTSEADELGAKDNELENTPESIEAFLGTSYDHAAARPKDVCLHHSHRYWKNADGQTPAAGNPGYVISTFLSDLAPVPEPGIANATNENRDETSSERTWSQALPLYSVEGFYLAPNALNDDALAGVTPTRTIPLAGRYYSEMQFYNLHNLVDDGNTTDEAKAKDDEQISAATKILRIQRTVPSMTFMQLPFDGQNDVSLSNFQDPELPAGETAWKDQPIAIRSNNKVTIKVENAYGMNATWEDRGTIELYPTEAKYSTVLQTTLGELSELIAQKPGNEAFIDPDKVGYDTDGGYRRYRITISGYRQKEKDGADEKFTTVLNYYSGYWIVHPETAQIARGGKYSYGGFELLLDFSGSAYHKDQRVRVGRRKFHIGNYNNVSDYFTAAAETPVGETEYTEYKLDGSKYQRYIKYPVPHNGEKEYFYIYWVEYKPYGGNDDSWTTVWSDNGYGSKPSWNSCLFSQEAYSPNSLVFLQHGPVVPAIPGPATMNRDQAWGYVDRWDNRDKFAEAGASIQIKKQYTIMDETYRQQGLTDPFTGNTFGITCQAKGASTDYNKAGDPFCSQATADAYKALWGGDRHVFRGWRIVVTGKHSCVGSRQHTRTSDVKGYWSQWLSGVHCPDGHGITREWLQIFERITPTYITTASENLRGPLELMVVRNAITARPGSLPIYNTGLEGTQQ